jgi:NAD+ synthase (glutamine-hydrolysing)
MLIHLSQIAPVVGDFEGNVKKIKASYDLALKAGARLCLTPELSLNGYPPHDLLERPEIFERNKQAL